MAGYTGTLSTLVDAFIAGAGEVFYEKINLSIWILTKVDSRRGGLLLPFPTTRSFLLEAQAWGAPPLPHLRRDEVWPSWGGHQGRHLPWQNSYPQAGLHLDDHVKHWQLFQCFSLLIRGFLDWFSLITRLRLLMAMHQLLYFRLQIWWTTSPSIRWRQTPLWTKMWEDKNIWHQLKIFWRMFWKVSEWRLGWKKDNFSGNEDEGKDILTTMMMSRCRKGEVGDWINHLTEEQVRFWLPNFTIFIWLAADFI